MSRLIALARSAMSTDIPFVGRTLTVKARFITGVGINVTGAALLASETLHLFTASL